MRLKMGSYASKKDFSEWNDVNLLSTGVFGKIYLVRNRHDDSLYIRKEMPFPVIEGENWDELEDKIVKRLELRHHNIVKVFKVDVDHFDRRLFMYIEYSRNGSLREIIETNGKLSESTVKCYTAQLLSGLEYLHSKGVIHRIVAPENIFYFRDNCLKLANISGSNFFEEISSENTVVDTNYYMSKEVFKGNYEAGCDVWSLGIVVIEMATGKLPWQPINKYAAMRVLKIGRPPDVDSLPISQDMRRFLLPFFKEECQRPAASKLLKDPWLQSD